jgi:hypothetical protein
MKTFVYAIERADDEAVKIGWSYNPYKRLGVLRSTLKKELRLLGFEPGGRDREMKLHRQFRYWRIKGEWFRNEGAVERFVNSISIGGEQPDHCLAIPMSEKMHSWLWSEWHRRALPNLNDAFCAILQEVMDAEEARQIGEAAE